MASDELMENLSSLSEIDIERQKLALWDEDDSTKRRHPRIGSLVAVGDSWFSYPLALDILDQLKSRNYRIRRFAKAGDTLENMVFGASFNPRTFERRTPPLDQALTILEKEGADAFLFSGGGNDVAGESLESYLDHRQSNLPSVRADYVEHMIFTVFRTVYEAMVDRVQAAMSGVPIIIHGYGRPIPDGRGYRRIGIEWAGPWLRPAFTRKGIVQSSERRAIIGSIIDQFNEMLAQLAADHEQVHYIDLRGEIRDDDWENELHVDSRAYARIAKLFHETIVKAQQEQSSRPHDFSNLLPPGIGEEVAFDARRAEATFESRLESDPEGEIETGAGLGIKANLDVAKRSLGDFATQYPEELALAGLPSAGVEIQTVDLQSWSGAHMHRTAHVLVLTASGIQNDIPVVAHQLAVAANLAKRCGVRLRPIGHHQQATSLRAPLHNWSPIHLDPGGGAVLYVSFEKIAGIIDIDTDGRVARVYCGTQICDLARRLHAFGLTIPAVPAPGVLSVGGAIAIGGHGSRLNDAEPGSFKWPGTISATIDAATVIAWDGNQYAAKRVRQGSDELAFAAVSLGRAMVVDVTLRVRKDYRLFTEFTRHDAGVLLGPEASPNSLAGLLRHQNLEVLAFRHAPGTKPNIHTISWRATSGAPGEWASRSFLSKLVVVRGTLAKLVGASRWQFVAREAHRKADALIGEHGIGRFEFGPAAAQRMYVTSDTLKVEPLGWALVLPRAELQIAAHKLYRESQRLLADQHDDRLHQHLALELRLAEMDDTGQPDGAFAPTLSVAAPTQRNDTTNSIVMWVNVISVQTRHTIERRVPYLRAFEQYLLTLARDQGWVARPEWSKGWAYADRGAWSWPDDELQGLLDASWPGGPTYRGSWQFARRMAWRLDPHGVFTTRFHDRILPRADG